MYRTDKAATNMLPPLGSIKMVKVRCHHVFSTDLFDNVYSLT